MCYGPAWHHLKLSVCAEKAPCLLKGHKMNNTGLPTFKGEQCKLALSDVSSNQDVKLSIAYTTVTLEGAQHQGIPIAWIEPLAEHSWPGSLRANPSNEDV